MASIVWTDVAALPNVPTISTTGQAAILGVVNSALDVSAFDGEAGPITKLARMFLAAHFASLAQLGRGGVLAAESGGGLSRSYAMPPLANRSWYMTTSYGSAFYGLLRPQVRGPIVL